MIMDSFEFNKITASILVSLLIAMAGSLLSEQLVRREHLTKNAIDIKVQASGKAESGDKKEGPHPIGPFMATANVEHGKEVAKKCQQCHTLNAGGPNTTGPNLFGIVGAKFGHKSDYPYSTAFKDKPGTWNEEELSQYLYKPRQFAPGTKMSFVGISDEKERADLIAYLKTLKS
jgi:cytochrome c